MARDAGVEGALRADQHWLPQGTMQVGSRAVSWPADMFAVCMREAQKLVCYLFLP